MPAGAPTARSGRWVLGPGADFFQAVQRELGALPFIVEDLGLITPDVHALRDHVTLSDGKSGEAAPALMSLAWRSVAALSMAPLQDLLNLGKQARMNVPGRAEGNWGWRCTEDMLSDPAFERLHALTNDAYRSGAVPVPHEGRMTEAVSRS